VDTIVKGGLSLGDVVIGTSDTLALENSGTLSIITCGVKCFDKRRAIILGFTKPSRLKES